MNLEHIINYPNTKGMSKVAEISELRPTITYQLGGPYSYERHTEPDVEYFRYLNGRDVNEWLEHALQLVRPYTQVRLTLEVLE